MNLRRAVHPGPRRPTRGRFALAIIALALAGATFPGAAHAQRILDEPPPELAAADIIEKRGETIDLDAQFMDQNGNAVRIGDYFDGERPVVLVLAYLNCPVVCPVVLNNTQRVFNELAWAIGDKYRAITLSFDHRDTPEAAGKYHAAYQLGLDRSTGSDSWVFLTGDAQSIRRVCDSVGWQYAYIPATGDFSHPTAIIVLSPDGKVSNYLYGVRYAPQQLRLSLLDASEGRIGDVFDRILLRCYHYDPDAGSFVLAAERVMTIAAVTTVVLLGGVIAALVQIDRRRNRQARAADAAQGMDGSDG